MTGPTSSLTRGSRLLAAGLALGAALAPAIAQTVPGPSTIDLEQRLAQPVTALWTQVPLGTVLRALAQTHGVAVLLDRRVDPEQPVEITVPGAPLGVVFEQLAEDHDLGVSRFGAVLYVGPPAAARRLRTQAAVTLDAVNDLPAARRSAWLARQPLAWDDFAEPRALLAELALAGRVRLVGIPEAVPHDLWAAADLPPMSLAERITLIAVQYNLALEFSPDGSAARLVPVPEQLAVERSYPGGPQPAARARQWREQAPESEIRLQGGQIVVRGLVEDHEALFTDHQRTTTAPDRSEVGPPIEQIRLARFRIRLQPVGPILEEIGRRLGLEVRLDEPAIESAGVSLSQRVTVEVENVSVDGLLGAVLEGTGLAFVREGTVVSVHPATAEAGLDPRP